MFGRFSVRHFDTEGRLVAYLVPSLRYWDVFDLAGLWLAGPFSTMDSAARYLRNFPLPV